MPNNYQWIVIIHSSLNKHSNVIILMLLTQDLWDVYTCDYMLHCFFTLPYTNLHTLLHQMLKIIALPFTYGLVFMFNSNLQMKFEGKNTWTSILATSNKYSFLNYYRKLMASCRRKNWGYDGLSSLFYVSLRNNFFIFEMT